VVKPGESLGVVAALDKVDCLFVQGVVMAAVYLETPVNPVDRLLLILSVALYQRIGVEALHVASIKV